MPTARFVRPLFLLLLALFVHAGVAAAQSDPRADAKKHYLEGRRLFDAGQYQQAIGEFQAADQLAPSGINDFNIGYAYEQLGDAADAVKYYQSYLTRVPDATNKASVSDSITRLQQQVAAEDAAKQAAQAKADADAKAKADAAAAAAAAAAAQQQQQQQQQGVQPPPPTAAHTGDPDLDRVAAIDVNGVRDQRQPSTTAAGAPPAGAGTGAAGRVASNGSTPAPSPSAPAPAGEPKKAKPLYKQWWFWVVAGVSAYVLISILSSGSSNNQPGGVARDLPMPTPTPTTAGFSMHF